MFVLEYYVEELEVMCHPIFFLKIWPDVFKEKIISTSASLILVSTSTHLFIGTYSTILVHI